MVIVVVAVIAIGGGGVGDVALAKQPGTASCADTKKLPKCKNMGRGVFVAYIGKIHEKVSSQTATLEQGRQTAKQLSEHPSQQQKSSPGRFGIRCGPGITSCCCCCCCYRILDPTRQQTLK